MGTAKNRMNGRAHHFTLIGIRFSAERSSRFQQKVELTIEKLEREGGLKTALYIGRVPLRAI